MTLARPPGVPTNLLRRRWCLIQVNFTSAFGVIMASMGSSVSLLRRVLAVLGLAAALTLVLQPLCSAYAGAHELDRGASCCAEMPVDALVASPSAESAKAAGCAVAAVPTITSAAATAPIPCRPVAWKDPPPPSLSYHARSARIQR